MPQTPPTSPAVSPAPVRGPGVLDDPPAQLATDIAVIGSGPGGAVTAALAAEAGRQVLLIEEGPYLPLTSCRPFSLAEMTQKYRHGGLTAALGPTPVNYVEARCVGGGSEINSGLYHRTPPEILELWRTQFDLQAATEADLAEHFAATEADLTVGHIPHGSAPAASLALHEGATRLGWKSLEVPRWFRYDSPAHAPTPSSGSGLPPPPLTPPPLTPTGTRQSMTETYIPRLTRAGGTLMPEATVRRLRRIAGAWHLLVHHHRLGPVEVRANSVFVAAGAVQTPALLRASGLTTHIADRFLVHPTVKVVARFGRPVNAPGMGVPVHQVKQFAPRYSMGCSISSPPHLALALAESPHAAALVADHWSHMAIYYAMTAPEATGSVRLMPGFAHPLVRYRLGPSHMADLASALIDLCRLLLAAGATDLWPCLSRRANPTGAAWHLRTLADLATLPRVLPAGLTPLMSIHLFGTTPLGERRDRCAVNSFGAVPEATGLYIADAGLLCTAPGVNPQGTVMALARRNVWHFLNTR